MPVLARREGEEGLNIRGDHLWQVRHMRGNQGSDSQRQSEGTEKDRHCV